MSIYNDITVFIVALWVDCRKMTHFVPWLPWQLLSLVDARCLNVCIPSRNIYKECYINLLYEGCSKCSWTNVISSLHCTYNSLYIFCRGTTWNQIHWELYCFVSKQGNIICLFMKTESVEFKRIGNEKQINRGGLSFLRVKSYKCMNWDLLTRTIFWITRRLTDSVYGKWEVCTPGRRGPGIIQSIWATNNLPI